MIGIDSLREILNYCPETGAVTWRTSTAKRTAGQQAGGPTDERGYLAVIIKGRKYYHHVIGWAFVNGRWPDQQIDHRDGVPWHNWASNLREATNGQNQHNQSKRKNNTSGVKGVSWHEGRQKWRGTVWKDGRSHSAGFHSTKEAAAAAVATLREQLHGAFTRH